MKRIEKVVLLLSILFILSHVFHSYGLVFLRKLFETSAADRAFADFAHVNLIMIVHSVLSKIVNIAVGIWLFTETRRSEGKPWIWLLFGIAFGMIGAIVFYVVRIYESKTDTNTALTTGMAGGN